MIISEKRHQELYGAIADPIMDLRIECVIGLSVEELDEKLFNLQLEIHKRIEKVLDFHKSPGKELVK